MGEWVNAALGTALEWLLSNYFALAIVAALSTLTMLYRKTLRLVGGPKDRKRLLTWVQGGGWTKIYLSCLQWLDAKVGESLGTQLLSERTLRLCLTLSFFYSYISLIPTVFQADLESPVQTSFVVVINLVVLIPLYSLINFIRESWPTSPIEGSGERSLVDRLLGGVISIIAHSSVFLLVILFAFWIQWINLKYDIQFTDYFASVVQNFAVTGDDIDLADQTEGGGRDDDGFWIFQFSVVLLWIPVANALFDFLSIAFTRYLIRLLAHDVQAGRILAGLKHILLDTSVAMALSFLLAVLIVGLCKGFDLGPLVGRMQAVADDVSYGDGWPFILMVYTTLFPTLIHFVCAVLALILPVPAGNLVIAALKARELSAMDRHLIAAWAFLSVMLSVLVIVCAASAILYLMYENGIFGWPYAIALYLAG